MFSLYLKMIGDLAACSKTITVHTLDNKLIQNYTHHRGIVNSVSFNSNSKNILRKIKWLRVADRMVKYF